ncbi:proline racemase family protein [Sporosarcina sp. ACRSL]|uniref:proline racemase family protein n=1 Tax=Sporosarcina sp. ACRSL TaxID=2918215 RepID=UPI001EF68985|nr:proline racemase family protein [Sporosarcina sp. ACRSL]MCG7346141.1 proline racemase family protein [Sporosarcina sp. ACRSL]
MNYEKMYFTIDTHVVGEAFRIVIQSPITFIGANVNTNHMELANNFETEKNLLLNEPRGHRGMNGCIVTSSLTADFQLIFFNHEGSNNFKYEGLLATVTALIETGNLKRTADDSYKVETVHGIYTVQAKVDNQEVTAVELVSGVFTVTESEVDAAAVSVDNTRNYLIYNLPESIEGIELEHLAAVNNWGIAKTRELAKANIAFDGVILVEQLKDSNHVRSVTFEKDGYILRSPGVDSSFALMTLLNTKESTTVLENESIFGSSLTVHSQSGDENRFSIQAVPFVTGSHEFIFDPEDPLENGFLLA